MLLGFNAIKAIASQEFRFFLIIEFKIEGECSNKPLTFLTLFSRFKYFNAGKHHNFIVKRSMSLYFKLFHVLSLAYQLLLCFYCNQEFNVL